MLQVDHPAVDVVQARLREGSRPGKRRDSHKVGLVVEGGGMRGVVTGAALQAMHDLGMRCVQPLPHPQSYWLGEGTLEDSAIMGSHHWRGAASHA